MKGHSNKAAFRSLMLPIGTELEEFLFDWAVSILSDFGVPDGDIPTWIRVQLSLWERNGKPNEQFAALIGKLLFNSELEPNNLIFGNIGDTQSDRFSETAKLASEQYFVIHQKLTKELLSHTEARQLLSHLGLVGRLAIYERMSASEIARLIAIKDARLDINWKHILCITSKLRCNAKITVKDVKNLYEVDRNSEAEFFGDSDINQSILLTSKIATSLSCSPEIETWLRNLFAVDAHPPYRLILHYQLTIIEFYDHAVSYAYEFSPRGQAVKWLNDAYLKAHIPVAKNAFLNNAKALLRFDRAWVTGRTDHLSSADGLASILEQLETMSSAAKREIASRIRVLLHKHLRLSEEEYGGTIPFEVIDVSDHEFDLLRTGIINGNTKTAGVLEQRITDCLGLIRHTKIDGWINRGIGDSVFAANLFRKKLGDCEFISFAETPPIMNAYEAHGGKLTKSYVVDHIDTFINVLEHRLEEFEGLKPIDEWALIVTFVAHSFGDNLPNKIPIQLSDGRTIRILLQYFTFESACEEIWLSKDSKLILHEHFFSPIHSINVHPDVRQTVCSFIGRN